MKKLRKLDNRGFGLWEWILLLLLLLILIFIFWYVLQQNKKNEESDKPQSNVIVGNKDEAKEEEKDTKKYLEIKEWDVKLELGDKIEDAIYEIHSGFVYMSTTSYEDFATCKQEKASLGNDYLYYQALTRYSPSDELDEMQQEDGIKTAEQAAKKYPDSYKKVGNHYYTFSRGNGIECNPDESKISDFQTAFKTIQAI